MKIKWNAFLLAMGLTLSLTACSATQTAVEQTQSPAQATATQTQSAAPNTPEAATATASLEPTAVQTKRVISGEFITSNGGYDVPLSDLEHQTDSTDAPVVYYTSQISSDALLKIYEALDRTPAGKVAVKLSTGEPGGHYYLDPNLIKDLVQSVDGTIVECNTAYVSSRATNTMHMQVAKDHGFTAIADVDIMDSEGSLSIPVAGGSHLKENLVGSHLANYNFVMVLSHFKGHTMAGFGGALKNISIGIGSAEGKSLIHSAGKARTGLGAGTSQEDFTESMAEAAKAVSDYEDNGQNMLYISVMNHLSVDCDCDNSPEEPTMKDVGILASLDPVALDQACVDIVYSVPDGADLIERMESRGGIHILEHAEQIGLGSRSYHLVDINK